MSSDRFDEFDVDEERVAVAGADVGADDRVREKIRIAALAERSPSAALEAVNRTVLYEFAGTISAILAVYDRARGTLTYAAAGHPPPFLELPGGLVRRLPFGGLSLGAEPAIGSADWTFTIPAGGRVVFSNGDVERSDFVLARTAPVSEYTFSATPLAAPIARAVVAHEIAALPLDEERRYGILVAVGEAIANAVEHAYRDCHAFVDRVAIVTAHDRRGSPWKRRLTRDRSSNAPSGSSSAASSAAASPAAPDERAARSRARRACPRDSGTRSR